jgi:hypothetical protein
MIAQGRNDFKLVNDCLSGDTPVTERVFEAVAVLSERLDKLKRSSTLFSGISMSEQFEELALAESMSAIC